MGIAEMQVGQIRETGQEVLAKLMQFRNDADVVKAEYADKIWAYESAYRAGVAALEGMVAPGSDVGDVERDRLARNRDRDSREAKEVMVQLLDELHERRYILLNEFFRRTGNIVKTNDEPVIFGGTKDVCG